MDIRCTKIVKSDRYQPQCHQTMNMIWSHQHCVVISVQPKINHFLHPLYIHNNYHFRLRNVVCILLCSMCEKIICILYIFANTMQNHICVYTWSIWLVAEFQQTSIHSFNELNSSTEWTEAKYLVFVECLPCLAWQFSFASNTECRYWLPLICQYCSHFTANMKKV